MEGNERYVKKKKKKKKRKKERNGKPLGVSSARKHAYIVLTPLKPHFYTVKLRFKGVYIIFLILPKNIDCGYSLEAPRRGDSNEYQQSMF